MNKINLLKVKKFLIESLSLSSKLFGIYLVVVLVLSLWISSYTESLLKAHLHQQLEEQGKSIARNIADVSVNHLLTENIHSLNRMLKEHINSNKNIEYILIFDWAGNLFTHTLPSSPSDDLLNISNSDEMQVVKTDAGYIWDFSAPITDYQVGVVRVGISESKQLAIVKAILSNIFISLMVFFVISAIIVSTLHKILTKPITELVKGTQMLSKGKFDYRVPNSERKDEMGKLITSFNQMIEDLQNYKKKTGELDNKRRFLLEKVINIQEEERKLISMELHDEIGQSLTGVKLNLKSLEHLVVDQNTKDKIIDLHTQVSQSLTSIHDIIVEIGPRFLEGKDLVKVFERYVYEYEQRYSINVLLEVDNPLDINLVNKAKASIFRIMQEALTNIAKYAQATEINISLQKTHSHLILIIEDNGVGFNVQKEFEQMSSNKNMGLFSMQERTSLLDGNLLIESEQGIGTTIFVRIPLRGIVEDDTYSIS
ncbi:hypothetical protein BKP35_08550 [Anaerobacillus arseniciselenatis]|uniref:histidine kinase n=1 Tax=Anaerobacillus arseniciselenatis TaxID=85682 RepID=A0A1S2LQ49_9BACI|nr:ATP-binding protein [Anaerobacillus arseniciselenatis]OIJ13817.1 hypothetical protein BKP35_08550 [Anaerobacillus arseniciselenatis]